MRVHADLAEHVDGLGCAGRRVACPKVDVGVPGPGGMGVDGAGAAQGAGDEWRRRLDGLLGARDVRDEWHATTVPGSRRQLVAVPQSGQHRRDDPEHHQHAARGQRQVQPMMQAALGVADHHVSDLTDVTHGLVESTC